MVSLHLFGLKGQIKLQDRQVSKAMKRVDTLASVKFRATQALSAAREAHIVARADEKAVRNARGALVAAAVAEADSLRREHTVGL